MNFNAYTVEDMRGITVSITYCVSIHAQNSDHLVRSILSYLNKSGRYKTFRLLLRATLPGRVGEFLAIQGDKGAVAALIRALSAADVEALYASMLNGTADGDSPLILVSDADCAAGVLKQMTETHNREYQYYVADDL